MHIVLDTSVIYDNYFFDTPKFEALFEYLEKSNHSLFLPEIVLLELKKHYSNKLEKIDRQVQESNRILKLHVDFSIDSAKQSFEDKLEELIENKKVVIVKTSQLKTSIEDLQMKFVDRHKPIKKSGAGFQDVLVWESVKEVIRRVGPTHVSFISGNVSDFGEVQIYDELQNEISADSLLYFNSIEDFLSGYSEPVAFITEDFVKNAYSENKDLILELLDQTPLLVQPEGMLEDLQPDYSYDLEIADERLQNFYIYRSDSDNYYVQVEFSINLWMYVEIDDYDGPAQAFVDLHLPISVNKKTQKVIVLDDYLAFSQ